jgi:hypothetical protein
MTAMSNTNTEHRVELAPSWDIASTCDRLATEGFQLLTMARNPDDARFVLVFARTTEAP